MSDQRLPNRDEERFREIFDTSYRPLTAYARRRTAGIAEADDVVSETYAVAWRRRADIPADPLPWLYGVAANVLSNQRRSQHRRLRLVDKMQAQPTADRTDSSEIVITASLDPALERALSSLSEADQELLKLLAWEELSHAEIGEVLSCSANAVGIRVHRARARLETALQEETPHEENPHEENPHRSHPNSPQAQNNSEDHS